MQHPQMLIGPVLGAHSKDGEQTTRPRGVRLLESADRQPGPAQVTAKEPDQDGGGQEQQGEGLWPGPALSHRRLFILWTGLVALPPSGRWHGCERRCWCACEAVFWRLRGCCCLVGGRPETQTLALFLPLRFCCEHLAQWQ